MLYLSVAFQLTISDTCYGLVIFVKSHGFNFDHATDENCCTVYKPIKYTLDYMIGREIDVVLFVDKISFQTKHTIKVWVI